MIFIMHCRSRHDHDHVRSSLLHLCTVQFVCVCCCTGVWAPIVALQILKSCQIMANVSAAAVLASWRPLQAPHLCPFQVQLNSTPLFAYGRAGVSVPTAFLSRSRTVLRWKEAGTQPRPSKSLGWPWNLMLEMYWVLC